MSTMGSGRDQGPITPEPASARRASVTLRTGDGRETDGLDPANQSLSEALKLVSRVLNFSMLVLASVFLLSGLTSIRENEVGVRLLFGKVTGSNLPPGFHFSWPYPMGEIRRVNTGLETLELDGAFWPRVTPEQARLPIQQLAQQLARPLNPAGDGALITADQNLAHTQWRVNYVRRDPVRVAENLLEREERDVVAFAVQRGVVHAVAQMRIDDLLRPQAGDTLAMRARALSQRYLDEIESGIEITELQLRERVPPLMVYGDFSRVQSAEQKAASDQARAESQGQSVLNAMAGEASGPLIAEIDAYAQAIEAGDESEQARRLERIRGLLDGRERGEGAGAASGAVARILNDAREYASSVVNRRRTELASFESKLAQYRVNPAVVVQREWVDGMRTFLGRTNVEQQLLPPGTRWYRLLINRDPKIVRDLERVRKEQAAREATERRTREFMEQRFRTQTGTQAEVR